MNDEIKEIINYIDSRIIPREHWNEIKDYITNLQQELEIMVKDNERNQETIIRLTKENEGLKDSIVWWKDRFFGQQEYDDSHRITAIEYKKRLDKAIELYQTCKEEDWCTLPIDMVNILQGENDATN